jgi:hypothetical protein
VVKDVSFFALVIFLPSHLAILHLLPDDSFFLSDLHAKPNKKVRIQYENFEDLMDRSYVRFNRAFSQLLFEVFKLVFASENGLNS